MHMEEHVEREHKNAVSKIHNVGNSTDKHWSFFNTRQCKEKERVWMVTDGLIY